MKMQVFSAKGFQDYLQEREKLSQDEVIEILQKGRKWDVSGYLSKGGSVFFPHTYLHACGEHIASVVHGCLDSGADQVLALGVLHAHNEELRSARQRERKGLSIINNPFHGIFGPGIDVNDCWKIEYSLLNFTFLWNEECKQRGIKGPKLILRYPSLAACSPQNLPGIQELKSIAKDSVVVATADLCHHGPVYGTNPNETKSIGVDAEKYAFESLMLGLDLLERGDFRAYLKHCDTTISDGRDTGTVLRYLLGPLKAKIYDLKLVDVSSLFETEPEKSWVAAALVAMEKI